MSRKKSLAWTIICVVVCVIFVPIIVGNVILSVKGLSNKDQLPTLFGYSPTAVLSGSMAPEINEKDLIFIKQVDTDTLIQGQDIICFVKDGSFVTHRLARIEIVDGVKHFITAGDATGSEDDGFVLAEQIQGKYVGKISGFGGVILFLQNPYGLMLTIILLVLLYIAGELLIEYVATRKENAILKQEIERLKAMLGEQPSTEVATVVAADQPVVAEQPVQPDQPVVAEQPDQPDQPVVADQPIEEVVETPQDAPVEPVVETPTEPIVADEEDDDDGDEVIIEENGLQIRYRYKRSFQARLIQSGDNVQDLYTQIKNYVLQHKGTKSRISWGYETFSNKRNHIAKLCMRGKSLYAYFALTDEEIETLRIDEKVETHKFSTVPAKIKVTGVIKLHRAFKAIDTICARLGLAVGTMPTEVYSFPYQTDEQLLAEGLVKLVKSSTQDVPSPVVAEQPDQPDQPVVADQPVQPDQPVEPVVETPTEPIVADEEDDDDGDEVIIEENGLQIRYRYKRSFQARLIQSGDNVQDLYTQIKNYVLQHKGTKSRISWGYETFSNKRNHIAKLCMRGKSLYAYFALTDEEIETLRIDEKVETHKFSTVPAKIKVTGVIKLHRAFKAIDTICARLGLAVGTMPTAVYSFPYENDGQLLGKGLVKLVKGGFAQDVELEQPPVEETVASADEVVDQVAATVQVIDEQPSAEQTVTNQLDVALETPQEQDQVQVIIDEEDIADTPDVVVTAIKYSRQQYLSLPREKKKRVKTLIRHVDEHLYDDDTPSNIRKRQIAEMWRESTLPTNKRR